LAQLVIPAFHVIGLPTAFSHTFVGFWRENQLISYRKIAVTLAALVIDRDLFPKFAASSFTAITDDIGDDLASPAAHYRPKPAFVPSFENKGPHFIGFQNIFLFSEEKGFFQFRIALVFF
jgi:hypothetical protein